MLELRSQTNIAEVASQAPNVTLKSQGAAFGPSMGASIPATYWQLLRTVAESPAAPVAA